MRILRRRRSCRRRSAGAAGTPPAHQLQFGYIDTTIPKHLQADLAQAALHGTPPPAHVLPVLMQRIRADHHIDRPRIALLRLALTRTTTRHKELCVPQLNAA
ncbi:MULTISPECIES: type I-C CRISPR-associated protein Cas8c/Csd1 [unclassified Streptomyces]|uniref:type I-C CRISPR-associated protein Cas8c/Csd1 n=1 Tax=unclassified Streptomyces TaxID=2593676 RepID=UPI0036777F48